MPRIPLALAAALAAAACGGSTQTGQLPAEVVAALLDAQNAVRANAQPAPSPPLEPFTWSASAAQVAQAWADGCNFGHNSNRGNLGENIAVASPPGYLSPTAVIDGWAAEAADYDYASNTCSATCGHYTQIVWRSTVSVGCGKNTCPASSSPFGNGQPWDFWVCDYDPPGNFIGERPY